MKDMFEELCQSEATDIKPSEGVNNTTPKPESGLRPRNPTVSEIRRLRKEGMSRQDIAESFRVTRRDVVNVENGVPPNTLLPLPREEKLKTSDKEFKIAIDNYAAPAYVEVARLQSLVDERDKRIEYLKNELETSIAFGKADNALSKKVHAENAALKLDLKVLTDQVEGLTKANAALRLQTSPEAKAVLEAAKWIYEDLTANQHVVAHSKLQDAVTAYKASLKVDENEQHKTF
jgi:transcriptional regulator with XRE-family HTH domain